MVPIIDLVNIGEKYTCSRSLFSFVNRNLNTLGLRAKILGSVDAGWQGSLILFKVEGNSDDKD